MRGEVPGGRVSCLGDRFDRGFRPFRWGCPGWAGPMRYGPHHLVVFVLDDVAVPDELARPSEARLESRHLARVGDDRVLKAAFPWLWRSDLACELDRLDDLPIFVEDEALAVHDLEHDFVDVHRVGIRGGVVDLPALGRADRGFSVTGSIQWRIVQTPAETVPRSASTGPSTSSPSSSVPSLASSISATCRVTVAAGSGDRRQPEELRRGRGVGADRGNDPKLHDLSGRRRVGDGEVVTGNTAAGRARRGRRSRARSSPWARS
jgi:hypothetical protein